MEVYDIETLKRMFLYMSFNVETKQWLEFEVSESVNTLDGLIKHLVGNKEEFVSFNGLGFDAQVLQYIIDNHTRWWNLGNVEIIALIYKFSQRIIDDQKYGLFPPYREENFENSQIDLFKIHHFDNENKRTSLKWLEFTMDAPSVEEMPIHHAVETLSESDKEIIKEYCKNDIENTYLFYRYTIGDVEHDLYKGMDMIQSRRDLIEEVGLPKKAMSYSDVKIGDEINKMVYCKNTGKKIWDLYDLKLSRKRTPHFTFGECIPDYVTFRNPVFKAFYEEMKGIRVNLNEREGDPYPFSYNKTNYSIAQGGIHSTERNRIIIVQKGWRCTDADIGGQYPHFIIKRGLYPSQLGIAWLTGYTWIRNRRSEYKKKSRQSKKFKGLSDQFKLAQNGGGFGKTNEKTNWQYDPFVQFSCTIGNQFEILMLIEWLEEAGIHVISANTDGVVCLYEEILEGKYKEICTKWEKTVGNDVQGCLEFTDYTTLIQSSVNDYLAIKADGTIKKKGDFNTQSLLEKNPSRRIIAIAMEKYFVGGIVPRDTILGHKRIYDFCIGVKASKQYHYEVHQGGKKEIYHRLVRYYVSKEGGKLLKIKNPDSEADGNDVSQCEAGNWKITVANQIDDTRPISSYGIDYEYYIDKANERIDALERGKKRKHKIDPNQQNLF
jgi:hypothetical protein